MAKKEVKEKKKNTSYFKEMKAELKKVVWPTPKELLNNTVAVIGFVVIIAVIVFILDLCFDNVNKYGITKLQEKVQTSLKADENKDKAENDKTDEENNDADDANKNDEANTENVESENENTENATTEGETSSEENKADSANE